MASPRRPKCGLQSPPPSMATALGAQQAAPAGAGFEALVGITRQLETALAGAFHGRTDAFTPWFAEGVLEALVCLDAVIPVREGRVIACPLVISSELVVGSLPLDKFPPLGADSICFGSKQSTLTLITRRVTLGNSRASAGRRPTA